MLSGVFHLKGAAGESAVSRISLSRIARAETGSYEEPVIKNDSLTCYARKREDVDLVLVEDRRGRTVVLCGFVATSLASIREQLAVDPEAVLLKLPGAWNALIYDPNESRVLIASDRLGVAWVYYVRVGDSIIFSSRFDVCARALPAKSIHLDAALSTLELGYAPANATCFDGLELIAPGAICELGDAGCEVVAQETPTYGTALAGLDRSEKLAALDAAYERAVEDWCPDPKRRYMLSLSGGYDSRAMLGAMLAAGRDVHCVSFGRARTPDSVTAMRVAKRLGLPHELLRIPKPRWDDLAQTFSAVGGIGGTPFVQGWAQEWMRFVRERNDNLAIGFLGGVLTGAHGGWSRDEPWLDFWNRWSCDGGFLSNPLLRDEFRQELPHAIQRETDKLPQADVVHDFQRLLHVNLYSRQRRCIGIQPAVIGANVRPLMLFYHPAVLAFWSNVEFDDLRNQGLYLAHARSRYPMIFPNSKRSLGQRATGAATNALVGMAPGLRDVLKPQSYKQASLWRLHKARVTKLFEQHWDFVNLLFHGDELLQELDDFPHSSRLSTMNISRLVGVLVLLGEGYVEGGIEPAKDLAWRPGPVSEALSAET